MTNTLENVVVKYLTSKKLSAGTCKEYRSTATKWLAWGTPSLGTWVHSVHSVI
jgi:hypothetical protein